MKPKIQKKKTPIFLIESKEDGTWIRIYKIKAKSSREALKKMTRKKLVSERWESAGHHTFIINEPQVELDFTIEFYRSNPILDSQGKIIDFEHELFQPLPDIKEIENLPSTEQITVQFIETEDYQIQETTRKYLPSEFVLILKDLQNFHTTQSIEEFFD